MSKKTKAAFERKVKAADNAIAEVGSDTSVPASETLEALRSLRGELDARIDAIEHDLIDQKFSSQG